MTLSAFVASNRDALVCDMAETYGVLDMAALPVPLLATLAAGLGEDSRSRRAMSGTPVAANTLLLAAIVDSLAGIYAALTGAKPAKSMVQALTGGSEPEGPLRTFDSGEDFFAAREQILKEAEHGCDNGTG